MESIKLLANFEALHNSFGQKAHSTFIVSIWHKTQLLFSICSSIDKIRIIRCPIILLERSLQFYFLASEPGLMHIQFK